IHSAAGEELLGGRGAEVRGELVRSHDAPFPDSGLVEDLLGRPVRVELGELIVRESALGEMVLERLYRCHAHGPRLGPPVACAEASLQRWVVQVANPAPRAA